ncbi:alpha-ketoglutarate-dependent dioxygenase AlkB [Chitinophaga sp. GCM10012297]|uniref:Alpha-ketoglutarate-dependent dioxygenase AlkB n=1 Tax=Chitinophaga chungangae TaxID=2821488 RepID=A0ABS3YD48_9BACT|nr:alpha-ketoglutarate-dependent dioxygenase AlkB [Chitinophaga chungangae]MBO9152034.1 alpha-ketoglutarate-dependent dioxygenase AlkB [Chitinophaga chungangae]
MAQLWHGLGMLTLFDIPLDYPPGFLYFPGFISEKEETSLVETIAALELHTFMFQGYAAKRKTASFGFDYSFKDKHLKKGRPIPETFSWLIEKVARAAQVSPEEVLELLVTEYPPGAVINWHRDAPPFNMVAGISLLSDCSFRLRPHEEKRPLFSFPVERRSLYIMAGEARALWQHSIAPVQQLRYSITLRTVKNSEND